MTTRRCANCNAHCGERCPKCASPKLFIIGSGVAIDPAYDLHNRLFKCADCNEQFIEGTGGTVPTTCAKCERDASEAEQHREPTGRRRRP